MPEIKVISIRQGPKGAKGDTGPVDTTTAAALSSHESNSGNPHNVTKAQVGLGSVDNTADANKPISGPQQDALDALSGDITTAQTSANNAAINAAVADGKAEAAQDSADQVAGNLSTHTGNTSNPHNTTKSQVGLGNVDNTSDVDKPVSGPQQEALDEVAANARVDANKAGGRGRLLSQLASTSLYNPKVLFVGDSLSEGNAIYGAADALTRKFGAIQSEGPRGNIGVNLAGGAAEVEDAAYWHSPFYTVPASGSVEFKRNSTQQIESSGVVVYYVKESGAGTFKTQVSSAGGSYADVGTTTNANASLAGGVLSVTFPLRGLNSVKVVGVSGTVRIIGSRYINENRAGAQFSAIAKGGASITDFLQTPVAILNPILADIAPDVVVWQMAESASEVESNLPTMYSRINTAAATTPDWVFMPTYVQGAIYDQERAAVRNYADSQGQIYIDASEIANAENGLLSGDGVHPTTKGSSVVVSRVLSSPPFSEAPDKWGTANPTDNVTCGTILSSQLMQFPLIRPFQAGCVSGFSTANTSINKTDGALSLVVANTAVAGNTLGAILGKVFSAPQNGAGTDYTQPVGFVVSWEGVLRADVTARVFIGSNAADLSVKGFGLEFIDDSTARLIAHDGTTRVASATFGMHGYGSPSRNFLVWCENGMVHCIFANATGFGTTRTMSLAGGPTTLAGATHDQFMATYDVTSNQSASSTMVIHNAAIFTRMNVLP